MNDRKRLAADHKRATRQARDMTAMWERAWPHLYEDDRERDDIVVTTSSMRSRPLHVTDPPHLRRYLKASCHLAAADRELAKLHNAPHWHSDLPNPERSAHATPRHYSVLAAACALVVEALERVDPKTLPDEQFAILESVHDEIAAAMSVLPEPAKVKAKPLRCDVRGCSRKRDGRHTKCKGHRDRNRRAA